MGFGSYETACPVILVGKCTSTLDPSNHFHFLGAFHLLVSIVSSLRSHPSLDLPVLLALSLPTDLMQDYLVLVRPTAFSICESNYPNTFLVDQDTVLLNLFRGPQFRGKRLKFFLKY